MKNLLILVFILVGCEKGDLPSASEMDERLAQTNQFISLAKEWTCYQEVYYVKKELPWEIGGKRVMGPHLLIKKNDKGYLFAQKVPDCKNGKNSCGYWIRSTTYKGGFQIGPMETVNCPKELSKEQVLKLIKEQYSDEVDLKEVGE